MKGTAQRITQHKRFVSNGTHPNFCFAKTSFMLKPLCAITRLRRKMKTNKSIFNYVDCIRIFIPDLEKGLEYYHHKLGLQIAWKTDNAIGLLTNDG